MSAIAGVGPISAPGAVIPMGAPEGALGPAVMAAVLGAALLHASWNALVKSGRDPEGDTALIHLLAMLLALPGVLWLGWPQPQAWPYILASTAIHLAYYVTLAGAYRHGDLGLAYPLMRGSAPLLVALASVTWVGETLSALAWLGVLAISLGVLALGASGWALRRALDGGRPGKAMAFALANAVVIALYTVVDGLGIRANVQAGGHAWQYVLALALLDGLPFTALVLARRRRQGRATELLAYARSRWPLAALAGAASLGSYGIALWAMTRAPVAMVAALRETSVLFAALIGALVLRERFDGLRIGGTLVLVAGIAALRLG
jgi:phosphonate utilization associated putative membrane protein